MTAVEISSSRPHHQISKMLQVARHRVTRWFRPPEAELRRRRVEPHPQPMIVRGSDGAKMERHYDQHA